jgi:hypothetical protein
LPRMATASVCVIRRHGLWHAAVTEIRARPFPVVLVLHEVLEKLIATTGAESFRQTTTGHLCTYINPSPKTRRNSVTAIKAAINGK